MHFFICPESGCWIDSRNQRLDFEPPLDCSVVFTLEEEMQWPPVEVNKQSQAFSFAPPSYALKGIDVSNLSAKLDQDNFSKNCGKQFSAEQKICGNCGSPLR